LNLPFLPELLQKVYEGLLEQPVARENCDPRGIHTYTTYAYVLLV
jgi:hypothetical protein